MYVEKLDIKVVFGSVLNYYGNHIVWLRRLSIFLQMGRSSPVYSADH
jgi:hypothetical protein